MQPVTDSTGKNARLEVRCVVCGCPMYVTDGGNYETTYHCSSPEARFWDFDRGTVAQHKAKEHWEQSRKEIFLNRG